MEIIKQEIQGKDWMLRLRDEEGEEFDLRGSQKECPLQYALKIIKEHPQTCVEQLFHIL